MQKGDKNKLNLLLVGIKARLEQNQAYYVETRYTFKSGQKTFSGKLMLESKDFILEYNGMNRKVTAKEACDFFAEEAEKYEIATLHYRERGNSITIDCSAKGVVMKQAEEAIPAESRSQSANPLLSGREYVINVDKASALLKEIGILTSDGKLKNDMIRKYNQIDHYVELVAPMFKNDDSDEILLLDCACGKSYLSFVMNYYLRDVLRKKCRIIGIDYNSHVVEESEKMAKRLGYHNMEFLQADLRAYQPPKNVTAVISLHACDIATDLALATAIKAKAKYIACVPCCHKELLNQYKLPVLAPIIRNGVFRARLNDLLTDGLRTLKLEAEGYKVSVIEYISPLDTPKNLLIRAERTEKENTKAREEYDELVNILGTNSELDRRCHSNLNDCFFITDDDLK